MWLGSPRIRSRGTAAPIRLRSILSPVSPGRCLCLRTCGRCRVRCVSFLLVFQVVHCFVDGCALGHTHFRSVRVVQGVEFRSIPVALQSVDSLAHVKGFLRFIQSLMSCTMMAPQIPQAAHVKMVWIVSITRKFHFRRAFARRR